MYKTLFYKNGLYLKTGDLVGMKGVKRRGRSMFKIGYRTIKTAVGAALAIFIAQLLNLQFFASAGIITILCVQRTKQKSVMSSWARFVACIIGLIYGIVVFELIGYHVISIAIILLVFIPTTVLLKIHEGISTSTVIILHLYIYGQVTISFLLNEIILITVGVGVALLMNAYMPSVERELSKIKNRVENLFEKILHELAIYAEHGDQNWAGKEITEAADLLHEGKNIALQNLENKLVRYEDEYYHYFKMREKQLEIIERILPLLANIDVQVEQGEMIGRFLQDLSEGVNPDNTAHIFLVELDELRKTFKQMPLPKTREEFEARSALFYLLYEMEQYLYIKQQFKPIKKYTPFQ